MGTSDSQIRDQLKLTEATYWRRVKKMKELDRAVMLQKFTDDCASEVRVFEIRLLRDIMTCESIAANQSAEDADRLDAIRLKTDLGILMVKMYKEGPSILNVRTLEQQEIKHLGSGYIRAEQADIHQAAERPEDSESTTN